MALITGVLEILPDGRFVVTFGEDQITTLRCELPANINDFPSIAHAYLAGVAHTQLGDWVNPNPQVMRIDGEVI